MANKSKKRAVGMRLSEAAISVLQQLSEKSGISQVAVIEMLLREKAAKENIEPRS